MQSNIRKSLESKEIKSKKELLQDKPKTTSQKQDELSKRLSATLSTPRSYVKKSTATDVYSSGKSKTASNSKTPKQSSTIAKTSTPSHMKEALKSSPSSVSQISAKSFRTNKEDVSSSRMSVRDNALKSREKSVGNSKAGSSKVDSRNGKDLSFTNVTVNSPLPRRNGKKLKANPQSSNIKSSEESNERQRQKTRTLKDSEVKMLTAEMVDNNVEMKNLTRKLTAKPKAFFVDSNNDNGIGGDMKQLPSSNPLNSSSDDELFSYEDDFKSYESDFESYHSDGIDDATNASSSDISDREGEHCKEGKDTDRKEGLSLDEEKMLDSGNFELRDAQKSANKLKSATMDGIIEGVEDFAGDDCRNKNSMTDEGFLDMSNSSGVNKTNTYTESLDTPLFIDFKKSKENRRRRLIHEKLQQRSKDLLSMITLHEMSYSLFELKPIRYDLYMSTFGKTNYVQKSSQTYDDGIDEEVQTDDVGLENKWAQHPVEFSNSDICLSKVEVIGKNTRSVEDLVSKFTNLVNEGLPRDEEDNDTGYINNPLRIYLEQKNGAGRDKVLPAKDYESKVKNVIFSVDRLRKFLKRIGNKVNKILSGNIGDTQNDYVKSSKLSFSRGYKTVLQDKRKSFLKNRKVSAIVFSDTKRKLLLTIHKKDRDAITNKCLVCLWDISVANVEPVKVIVAIDNVTVCRFRGNSEGIFVAALEDGSVHLWDLSEEPTWCDMEVENETMTPDLMEVDPSKTQTELDREWNLKNRDVFVKQSLKHLWRASAYTSSAFHLHGADHLDVIVAVEFLPHREDEGNHETAGRVVGQFCSLQRKGMLIIWTITRVKNNEANNDVGKAYWSKMKMEKYQTISLLEYIDTVLPNKENLTSNFNLNLSKKRIATKRLEREFNKSRSKTRDARIKSDNSNIASEKKAVSRMLPDEKMLPQSWECGVVCHDLKVMTLNRVVHYLIAKNCGEVLICIRSIGILKVNRFHVSNDSTSITALEISPHSASFLAGTDSGAVHLCSMPENRVLLTLDCRSEAEADAAGKCLSDEKGRFVSSVAGKPTDFIDATKDFEKKKLKSIQWSPTNPCRIFALTQDGVVNEWDLLHSDIYPKGRSATGLGLRHMALDDDLKQPVMAVVTSDGDVQAHLLSNKNTKQHMLFDKYVRLL